MAGAGRSSIAHVLEGGREMGTNQSGKVVWGEFVPDGFLNSGAQETVGFCSCWTLFVINITLSLPYPY